MAMNESQMYGYNRPWKGEPYYIVRDGSGEYLTEAGSRSPAWIEAAMWRTKRAAMRACNRATDRVYPEGGGIPHGRRHHAKG